MTTKDVPEDLRFQLFIGLIMITSQNAVHFSCNNNKLKLHFQSAVNSLSADSIDYLLGIFSEEIHLSLRGQYANL